VATVNVRLDQLSDAPAFVPVECRSVLLAGRNVVSGNRGKLPGLALETTDETGLAQFVLGPGRFEIRAQISGSQSVSQYKVLIEVDDNDNEYEHTELIVSGAATFVPVIGGGSPNATESVAGLVKLHARPAQLAAVVFTQEELLAAGFRINAGVLELFDFVLGIWFQPSSTGSGGGGTVVSYTKQEWADAGLRVVSGILELFDGTANVWYPVGVRGGVDAEFLWVGNADATTPAYTGYYTKDDFWNAGLRVVSGAVEFWNPDQGKWFPVMVTGAIDAEDLEIGFADNQTGSSGSSVYTTAELNAAGLRVRSGSSVEFHNAQSGLWYPVFIGGEAWSLGAADTRP
jgi:hypothetical protein